MVPVSVTFASPEPRATRVMLGCRKVVVSVPGPVNVSDNITAPANAFGDTPRLVDETLTSAEPPEVKLTLLELDDRVKPLTLIVRTPEA